MNLPNKITISRIIMIPFFMLFAFPLPDWLTPDVGWISFLEENRWYFALAIYILASVTDFIDGHLARKNNLVTSFGKFLDPIADKLLVTAALLALTPINHMYLWATMVILTREFIVTGMRLVAASEGVVIAAGKMGKLKMVAQTIAIVVLLATGVFPAAWQGTCYLIGNILLGIAVVLTIVSGCEYVAKNMGLLKKDL